ncbi:MAG: hypothetical protein HOO96_32095 [Polyangiaceae bacterium]|nr:hypothetical protein [Polyangiaceae bacterium]
MLRLSLLALLPLAVACGQARAPDVPDGSSSGIVDPPVTACPTVGAGEQVGVLPGGLLEASGLAASRAFDGVLYSHNDSGDTARVFALGLDGSLRSVLTVAGAAAVDWEDLAIGSFNGKPTLYIGDIGDNARARKDIVVYRAPEPDDLPPQGILTGATAFHLVYPDGRARDAEALMWDDREGVVVIVTKDFGGHSEVFTARLTGESPEALQRIGELGFGQPPLEGGNLVTDGDLRRDGSAIVLRTYGSAYLWRRAAGQSLASAFAGAPCPLRTVNEKQGEAIAFTADGRGYFTTSEGAAAPLTRFLLQ